MAAPAIRCVGLTVPPLPDANVADRIVEVVGDEERGAVKGDLRKVRLPQIVNETQAAFCVYTPSSVSTRNGGSSVTPPIGPGRKTLTLPWHDVLLLDS